MGVRTNQKTLHPRLEEVVRRHLACEDRTPIPEHTRRAYRVARGLVGDRPVVLDSGCGVGESTRRLTERHPEAVVLGLDRSAHRLRRSSGFTRTLFEDQVVIWRSGGAVLLRADVPAFWRLALEDAWHPAAHYLFYPNPWPKARHLMRRWHGHPAFAALLRLGGPLELRTNWELYAREFAAALELAGREGVAVQPVAGPPMSTFERKYAARSETLWAVTIVKPPFEE